MLIASYTDGAYSTSSYDYCPDGSDWSIEYQVIVNSSANIFSGLNQLGKNGPNPFRKTLLYAFNDVSTYLCGLQGNYTTDDRVSGWKAAETPIPVKLSYNGTTDRFSLEVNGELLSSDIINGSDCPTFPEITVAINSSSETTFTPTTSDCTNYRFKDLKYYTEQIL